MEPSHCGPKPLEVWLCMPETTGRDGSSTRIAEAIVCSQFHACAGLSTASMQLHSLPRSQATIALRSFMRRTNARAKRPSHIRASGSVIRLRFSTMRGAKSRPDIQPVTSETSSLTPCASAKSQSRPKRASAPGSSHSGSKISSSVPSRRIVPNLPWFLRQRTSGWNSLHVGKTRISSTPCAASAATSRSTDASSHSSARHMRTPAFEPQ